jgi:hypothetical protein
LMWDFGIWWGGTECKTNSKPTAESGDPEGRNHQSQQQQQGGQAHHAGIAVRSHIHASVVPGVGDGHQRADTHLCRHPPPLRPRGSCYAAGALPLWPDGGLAPEGSELREGGGVCGGCGGGWWGCLHPPRLGTAPSPQRCCQPADHHSSRHPHISTPHCALYAKLHGQCSALTCPAAIPCRTICQTRCYIPSAAPYAICIQCTALHIK